MFFWLEMDLNYQYEALCFSGCKFWSHETQPYLDHFKQCLECQFFQFRPPDELRHTYGFYFKIQKGVRIIVGTGEYRHLRIDLRNYSRRVREASAANLRNEGTIAASLGVKDVVDMVVGYCMPPCDSTTDFEDLIDFINTSIGTWPFKRKLDSYPEELKNLHLRWLDEIAMYEVRRSKRKPC